MPQLRIFVSSTAYDLAAVREQLRNQIETLGHTPVLSEYADVLYDPRSHTHRSCVQELRTCDMVILLIGSRFGSDALPEFVSELQAEPLDDTHDNLSEQLSAGNVSVTQLEALTAFTVGLPVFVFVDRGVLHDLRVFNANQHLEHAKDISYPSITQAGVAAYIFNFISYVQARSTGNAVFGFSGVGEIQTQLRRQLSALFQRLLNEDRSSAQEVRRIEGITEQLEDLKTVVLSSIENAESRDVARGVIRFRLLNDLLMGLEVPASVLTIDSPPDWRALLEAQGVVGVVQQLGQTSDSRQYAHRPQTGLQLADGSIIEMRWSYERFRGFEREWEAFRALSQGARSVIVEALDESRSTRPTIRGEFRRVSAEEFGDATVSLPLDQSAVAPSASGADGARE